jgi:hypothetical protein
MEVQAMPGLPYFFLERPANGGTSILELMGGFNATVGGGAFPFRGRFYGATVGRLEIGSDENGATGELVHGTFISREPQNMAGAIIEGPLHDLNDWSDRKNELQNTMTEVESVYPSGAVGNTSNYQGRHGNERMGARSRLSVGSREVHVTNMRTDGDEDPIVGASIRERFG